MFSDHMRKIDRTSGRNLLFIAAGLVIICQLVAMAMVADGQVKKAEVRESRLSLQRVAIARCLEANSHSDRQSCLQQAGGDVSGTAPLATMVSSSEDSVGVVPSNSSSQLARAQGNNTYRMSPQAARGFMPVAFN